MTAKTVNYTPEMTAKILDQYANGFSVEDIAAGVGKTVRSVVAKLSREKVYKAKEYVSKNGTAPIKKDSLADKLAKLVDLNEAEADSLTKANKSALTKIIAALTKDQ